MSDRSGKKDDKETKQRFLDEINAHTAARINSWADLYEGMKTQIYNYFQSPSKASADFTITMMLTFVVALEELPEEGDARKIAERMNYLLVMGGDKTGVEVSFATEEERAETLAKSKELLSSLSRAALALASELRQPEDDETAPGMKRTLH